MSMHTAEAVALIHNRPGFAREVARQYGFTHVGEVAAKAVLSEFGLTPHQRNLLAFVKEFMAERGVPPSFDEMKKAMGLASKSGIHRMICALEERGHLFRLPMRARSIVLRDSAE